jgi:hypothetical protein
MLFLYLFTYSMKSCAGVEIWLHEFLISALDRSDLSFSLPAALPPGKGPTVLTVKETACASEPILTLWRTEMSFYPPGNRIRIPPPYIT